MLITGILRSGWRRPSEFRLGLKTVSPRILSLQSSAFNGATKGTPGTLIPLGRPLAVLP